MHISDENNICQWNIGEYTTMVDNNCIIEGNVKFRDGKKVSYVCFYWANHGYDVYRKLRRIDGHAYPLGSLM